MKRITMLAALVLAITAAAGAQTLKVGGTLENFSLSDTTGKTRALNDVKGKNGAVIVFLSAQCPVVRGYKDRINEIADAYSAKGINFVGINSNATESLDWVKSNMVEY